VSTVVYRTGSAVRGLRQFAWFDRSGKEMGKVGEPDSAGASSPSLSPDGHLLAINRVVNGNGDIWLLELARGVLSRFTVDAAVGPGGGGLVWSPDGGRIVFNSTRRGSGDLYQKPINDAESDELLLATAQNKTSMDISPDGRFLLYRSNDPKTSSDIWALPLGGDRKPVPLVQTSFDEREGRFSPDGKWFVYLSNETGRFEIFVQPFRSPGRKTQITTDGGAQVRWPRDGNELFYIARDGRLMAVSIRLPSNGQTIEPGRPVPLFPIGVSDGQEYMVSRDGQRFLINTVVEEAPSSITVILNWKSPAK
jgi:Tol biopolymer transport system component